MTGSIRVLHVGEEPDFADTTAAVLERENDRFRVEPATSAREGLFRLSECEFDCVVSGYDMPGANGIEFLETVREEYADLPFVLFTEEGSEAIASDAISAGVTDYLRKDGDTDRYRLLADCIDGAVDDVSGEKRHQRPPRSSERRFRKLADATTDAIVMIDADSTVQFVNLSLEDIFGYTPEKLEGESLTMLMPERYRESHREAIDRYLETGESRLEWSNIELPGLHRDGHEIDLSISFSEFEENGETRFTGIIRDITERKQREREKAFFEQLVKAVGIGVVAYDEEGRFRYVNPAYAGLLGAEPDRIEEMALWEICPDMDRDQFGEYWASFADGETHTAETVHRLEETEIPVETTTTRQTILGETYHFGTVHDIRDRKQKRRELQQQNERLEEFANVVSHDLRNPLGVADGRLELVREECDSDHLEHIEQAHERMETLIEDLLALAREGASATDIEAVVVSDLVEDCWQNVETDAATLRVDADLIVRADESRLRQLFENLVRNAVEHGSTSPPSQGQEDAGEHGSPNDRPGARRRSKTRV